MKKLIVSFTILFSLSCIAYADQLAFITKDQAEKGAAYIRLQKEVLLFCGCCKNDPKVYIEVTDVHVEHTGYQDFYQIKISGINRSGENVTIDADLAYVHVNRNGKAEAIGKILGFKCDPCVTDLKWESGAK